MSDKSSDGGNEKVKVFVSWSGNRSRVLAQALSEWLPLVLHYVEPWMSDDGIEAGQRWNLMVARELEASNYGIICITRENLNAPWLLFESGALAKSLNDSNVIPLLLDLDFSDISDPLAQFQAKKADYDGLWEVIRSINKSKSSLLPEPRARTLFEMSWPKVNDALSQIPDAPNGTSPKRTVESILEELVSRVRGLENGMTENAAIFPAAFLPRTLIRERREKKRTTHDRDRRMVQLMDEAHRFRGEADWIIDSMNSAYGFFLRGSHLSSLRELAHVDSEIAELMNSKRKRPVPLSLLIQMKDFRDLIIDFLIDFGNDENLFGEKDPDDHGPADDPD